MTTQAFIKFKNNFENYDDMLWINHDAFPEVMVPLIKEAITENTTDKSIIGNLVVTLNKQTDGNTKFFTIEKTLNQTNNYVYWVEILDKEIFLRIQEEYYLDSDLDTEIPKNYFNSEMRTIEVIQLQ